MSTNKKTSTTKKKTQKGGDSSISDTFNLAGDIVGDIGDTLGKVPVLGSVTKPITDIFSDVGRGISKAFSWLGLGTHIHHIEKHLGVPNDLTEEEHDYYNTVQHDDDNYIEKIHGLGINMEREGGSISGFLNKTANTIDSLEKGVKKVPLIGNKIHDKVSPYSNQVKDSARTISKLAKFFGLGEHIKRVSEYLDLPHDEDTLTEYLILESQHPFLKKLHGGKYPIAGKTIIAGKTKVKKTTAKKTTVAGKYKIAGNDNDKEEQETPIFDAKWEHSKESTYDDWLA